MSDETREELEDKIAQLDSDELDAAIAEVEAEDGPVDIDSDSDGLGTDNSGDSVLHEQVVDQDTGLPRGALGETVEDEPELPEVEPIDAGAVTFVMQNELGEEVLVNLPTIMTRLFQDMAGFYNELETLKAKVEGKEGRIIVPD
jgi:hypothetical protein